MFFFIFDNIFFNLGGVELIWIINGRLLFFDWIFLVNFNGLMLFLLIIVLFIFVLILIINFGSFVNVVFIRFFWIFVRLVSLFCLIMFYLEIFISVYIFVLIDFVNW